VVGCCIWEQDAARSIPPSPKYYFLITQKSRIFWATGRPFLCYQTVVYLSCPACPVCDVRALWPNGWTDQDKTWHEGRLPPWPHCVRWGPSSPSPKGHSPPTIFGPYLLQPNGCLNQDVTWYGARPMPRRLCVRWGPRYPSPKGGGGSAPQKKFLAHVYCDQTAGWMKLVLGMEVGLSQATLC